MILTTTRPSIVNKYSRPSFKGYVFADANNCIIVTQISFCALNKHRCIIWAFFFYHASSCKR